MTSEKYLKYTIEQKESVLSKFGRTVESIKEDVEAIKLWLEKQPHIPKNFDDQQIEHFLFANKFIFNNVKKSIDWYYRIRKISPNYFQNPDESSMVFVLNQFYFFPLPKLTLSNSRVTIMKIRNKALYMNTDTSSFIAYCINLADFVLNHDCPSTKVVVIDFTDFKLEFCTRFSPIMLKTAITIFEKAYRNGVQGIHFINVPSLLDTFVNLFKSLLSSKIVDRLKTHNNVNSMFEFISRDVFPKDYGGDEISIEELHELWKNELTKDLSWFKQRKDFITDETLRTGEAIDCDLLGFQGNFRKLNLD